MKDITAIFETYRECARHVRNTYFSTRTTQDWDIIEDFEEVEDILFKKLITDQVIKTYSIDYREIIKTNIFLIVPSATRMPVMISR